MLFNSLQFLIFFPVVTGLYFLLPHQWRWLLLLLASCIFYMAFIPIYLLVLLVLILIDFYIAIGMAQTEGIKRKQLLLLSILSTCAVLFVFKYFNFFNANFAQLAQLLGLNYPLEALTLILPIGLSFHTFQSLSYVIEVYRKKQAVEKNLGIYALYVMFYPQLVAGPIERPQNLLHQFYEKHLFDYQRVTDGLKLMAWGLFKKVVISDRLAVYVGAVFDHPHDHSGLNYIIATIFFAFQIYCDFSGYSDIALGAAQVMGFKLMKNFNRPYMAQSIAEFWTRWHISLSTWFKDYVYIPLGGNRVAPRRLYFNLFITFLISGLWHGANWTYIIWGALNGFYLITAIATADVRKNFSLATGLNKYPLVQQLLKTLCTFLLICFAWIFFRAQNINDAIYIVQHLFANAPQLTSLNDLMAASGKRLEFIIAVGLILFLLVIELIQRKGSIRQMIAQQPWWFRWACYYGIIIAFIVSIFFKGGHPAPFIYFQF